MSSGSAPTPVIRLDEFQTILEQFRQEFHNQAEIIMSILQQKHLPVYGLMQNADPRTRARTILENMTVYIDESMEVLRTKWILAKIEARIDACFKWSKRKFKRRGKKDDDKDTYEYKMVRTELIDPGEYEEWRTLRDGVMAWLQAGEDLLAGCRMIFDMFGDIGVVTAWRSKVDNRIASIFGVAPEMMDEYTKMYNIEKKRAEDSGDVHMRMKREAAKSNVEIADDDLLVGDEEDEDEEEEDITDLTEEDEDYVGGRPVRTRGGKDTVGLD